MLPACAKTVVWRELMESLSSKLGAPVTCGQAVFGKLPYFQELRNKTSDSPFSSLPGIRYVAVPVEGAKIIVGPFRVEEPHALDEELALARNGLPEWKSWHGEFIKTCVEHAVIAGNAVRSTGDALERAKVLLEFSQEVEGVSDVEGALTATMQFLAHRFRLNNVSMYAHGRQARQFDLSDAARRVEEKLVPYVKESKAPYVAQDVKADFMFEKLDGLEELQKCVVGLPLVAKREAVGCVVLYAEHVPRVDRVSEVVYELAELLGRMARYEQVRQSAVTDPLTGLYNRGALAKTLEPALRELREQQLPASVVICDIDDFKKFNDTKGHPEGDVVLKQVAAVLKESAPEGALCCRYGGEEFVMVLPRADQKQAKEIAERFREKVERECPLTVSVGVMTCLNSSVSGERLVREADKALYRAKHLGKNRVVSFLMIDRGLGVLDN